jgi:hypothetical protein
MVVGACRTVRCCFLAAGASKCMVQVCMQVQAGAHATAGPAVACPGASLMPTTCHIHLLRHLTGHMLAPSPDAYHLPTACAMPRLPRPPPSLPHTQPVARRRAATTPTRPMRSTPSCLRPSSCAWPWTSAATCWPAAWPPSPSSCPSRWVEGAGDGGQRSLRTCMIVMMVVAASGAVCPLYRYHECFYVCDPPLLVVPQPSFA